MHVFWYMSACLSACLYACMHIIMHVCIWKDSMMACDAAADFPAQQNPSSISAAYQHPVPSTLP